MDYLQSSSSSSSSSLSSSSSSSSSSNDSEYFLKVRKERSFQDRITEDYYSDEEFQHRYRFSKPTLYYLEKLIEKDLSNIDNRGCPLTVKQKIMLALRYYAAGCYQTVSGDLIGLSQSTVCYTIHNVSKAIARLAEVFIKMPETQNNQAKVITKFYSLKQILKVIGSIDCSHIPIMLPGGENAEIFRNRKGYFSVNVQAVCDSDCKFLDLVARWHGSAHDQTIFNFSSIKTRFESGEFGDAILIGDGGYGCKDYLITPYMKPQPNQVRFNNALCGTRVVVERAFGIWKRRFSVLAKASQIKLSNMLTIIVATAVLHNIAIELKDDDNDDEDRLLNILKTRVSAT